MVALTLTPMKPESEQVVPPPLQALLTTEQTRTLDFVDHLRRIGLGGVLRLPQLVVCGDQSSGKSTVLEAITGLPFPRKENLCTRFATEIVLRNHPDASITTKITSDPIRSASEQAKLQNFKRSISDLNELPELVNEAAKLMGLEQDDEGAMAKGFARDVLGVEICGPNRPQLTLVDLPGLVHSENKSQSKEDLQLVRSLVEEYISNERTIILPVISAKNDYANQIILQDCRKADPAGSRTLGIVTKPDTLKPGSDNERKWIDLLHNRDVVFELGWHVLKNREDDQEAFTSAQRDASEKQFFSMGSWRNVPTHHAGIENLRDRLSVLLEKHLKRELPGLRRELEAKACETEDHLDLLSERRVTIQEQRQFLMRASMDVHEIVKAGINGQYDHDFFGEVDISAAVDAPSNAQRLRATIHHLNFRFVHALRSVGHKYALLDRGNAGNQPKAKGKFVDDDSDDTECFPQHDNAELDSPRKSQKPLTLTHPKAVDWARHVLERTRGRELPGTFHPLIIAHLFKEQSVAWRPIADSHIDHTAAVCAVFVKRVMEAKLPAEVRDRLWDTRIAQALEATLRSGREELALVLEDKDRHPITYNHYFTTTVQKMSQSKNKREMKKVTKEATVTVIEKSNLPGTGFTTNEYIDPSALEVKMNSFIEQDIDKFAAEQVLNDLVAFYKDELKYFIGVVTKQVIERHLVSRLPSQVMSPVIIGSLSDEEVAFVAAESAEITQQRDALEKLKSALDDGRDKLRQMTGQSWSGRTTLAVQ